jgi:nitrogen fixation protein
MSENIDINVAIIKEEVSINAANNLIQVNINTAPISIINPQNYDLSQFTNTSFNPFVQQSTLGGYVPSSRIININGIAQDLSSDRSWTIPIPSITGLVPYIGATGNVNLGEYELKAGQLTLDTSPTGTAAVGTTRWNDTIGSSETTLKGGSVILKNGVDLVARVVNKVTPNTTLTKANYPVVRVSGAQGQRLAIAYAQANNDNNSADTLGLVIETIATNQEGFIMTVGQLEEVNTTGSLQGETWVDGDVLYLSPTTPGRVTNIKPTGLTGHIVVIGYVEYAHAVHGKIYVKIMNGWELDELHNVYINPATLANNDILQYDSTDSLWKNKVLATGLTVGTTPISSGTIGRVLFEGTGNVLQQSSSLFWDSTNNRLGIGTSTPTFRLEVQGGDVRFANGLTIGTAGGTGWQFSANTLTLIQNGFIGVDVAGGRHFNITNTAFSTYYFRVAPTTGNILINTTTDAGFRLDVSGTARFSDNLTIQGNQKRLILRETISGSTFFGIDFIASNASTIASILSNQSSGEIRNFVASGGYFSTFYSNGSERMRIPTTGNVLINTTTDAGFRLDVNGTARVQSLLTLSNGSYSTAAIGWGAQIGFYYDASLGIITNIGGVTISSVNGTRFNFDKAVGIGTFNMTNDASARLQINSTTQGFLPPRMTTTQKNAIASPAAGLMVYDTTLNVISYYNGTSWI